MQAPCASQDGKVSSWPRSIDSVILLAGAVAGGLDVGDVSQVGLPTSNEPKSGHCTLVAAAMDTLGQGHITE